MNIRDQQCIAGVLVAVDGVQPSLPVVLCQLVLGPADFAGDVVPGPRSGMVRPLQSELAGEASRVNASS